MYTDKTLYEMPIDELVARVINEIRRIAVDLPVNEIARDAMEAASMRRILDRLRIDAGLRDRNDNGVQVLSGILADELDRETLGWHAEFTGYEDPEFGSIGSVRHVRSLSDRGELIERVVGELSAFAESRNICVARLDAETLVLRRLAE